MENIDRYNKLNKYLKNKFGERTIKICIDGNFTCPNRDGKKGTKGCIFCSRSGSGDHLNSNENIQNQVKSYFNTYRSLRANKYIVYFQNFSNTYDSIENLKLKYDCALIDNRIVGLQIATRPDCITDEICKLLSTYQEKYYVCVELGLQTSNENTGKYINRCYTNNDFKKAVALLNKYNIDVVVHIMIGLPNESSLDLKNTIDYINSHKIQGLKIHSTYVIKGTKLCELYNSGSYSPITLEYYLDSLKYVITHIRPDIVIHRISGDAPKDLLIAPEWNLHKKWVLNGIDKILKDENLFQGIFFTNYS